MDSIEDHKNKFNEKVLEGQAKKGKNSRMLTKEHYLTTVERLKQLENLSEQRNLTDYNLMRRFALLRVESGGNIVEKLVKPGTNSRFVPFEDLFDVIHEVHIEKGHSGRDIMQKHMATRFANVTTDHINIYRSFCEKCGLKKSKARRGVVVKPILTPNVMARGQVDLIDMQVYKVIPLVCIVANITFVFAMTCSNMMI